MFCELFISLMFVVAMRVARSILERVYCCHRAKQMSARGVHKTQAKVPILGLNHVLPIQPMLASYIQPMMPFVLNSLK